MVPLVLVDQVGLVIQVDLLFHSILLDLLILSRLEHQGRQAIHGFLEDQSHLAHLVSPVGHLVQEDLFHHVYPALQEHQQ